MTPERWQQIKDLLATALEISPAERAAYLDENCRGDEPLRREVESLLQREAELSSRFLDHEDLGHVAAAVLTEEVNPWIGRRLGAYQIVEQIGAGGMGEVYRAFRADDQYRMEVALKVVRTGQDSASVITRFKNERQILASLEHPNIARLLDGGTTDEGVPYLVMELVDGVPIDQYCDVHKLNITSRLQLFRQVCAAVQHAHQHLVIHRDIKPSNILVTEDGSPKLLDFGIAKIFDSVGSVEATVLRPMTPEYASPEQIRGEAITTASDTYSLGVVLYQLLTGHSPYRSDVSTPAKLADAITHDEPVRPSISVQSTATISSAGSSRELNPETVSSTREVSPDRLRQRLRGDLDFILLKALRKESARRYVSVDQFSEDVRNHLEALPVTARKGTWSYLAGKFVRRHRTGVAAAALIVVMLVAGIVVILREARIAEANRQRAERRFNDVHKLADSLMFEVHDSIRELPGATQARKLIMERAQQYLDSLTQDSQSDPVLLRDLAAAYVRLAGVQGDALDANLGNSAQALQNDRRAVELLKTCVSLQPSNPANLGALASGYHILSAELSHVGDKNGSKDSAQKSLQIIEPLARSYPQNQEVQYGLGAAYEQIAGLFAEENDLGRAIDFYEKSLEVYQRLGTAYPANPRYQTEISFAHKHLGSVLAVQSQLQPALDHYRAALAIDEANLNLDPGNAQTRYNITYTYSDTGWVLKQKGDFDAALDYYGKALQIREALAAADPEDTRARRGIAKTCTYMGDIFLAKGKIDQCLASFRRGLDIREALFKKDPANQSLRLDVADSEARIGWVYVSQATRPRVTPSEELKFCSEAKEWLQKALPVFQQTKAEGKLAGREVEIPENLARDIDKCTVMIARLGRPADSSSH
jgi:serine/threonine protein kinase